jgi:hypothetical protein
MYFLSFYFQEFTKIIVNNIHSIKGVFSHPNKTLLLKIKGLR